jgi:hypothetical protein
MTRIRAAAGLVASVALLTATAGPVRAEPLPATMSIETAVEGYLGGWWEQEIPFSVSCDGYGTVEIMVDLPGATEGNVIEPLGPVPVGTRCWLEISGYPQAGDDGTDWDPETYDPGWELWLVEGDNHVTMTLPRTWIGEWPPEADNGTEHSMALTIDRVYLNGKGGIEVEGTSWCPEAEGLPTLQGDELALVAGVSWDALQYVGRKTALRASYDSGIAHGCWFSSEPEHGPYPWETRFAYPNGGLMFVYSPDGKLGSGSIHLEAFSDTSMKVVTQQFAPGGWDSDDGDHVPYDATCEDNNGDGWCVLEHFWFGFAAADLKPIRVR